MIAIKLYVFIFLILTDVPYFLLYASSFCIKNTAMKIVDFFRQALDLHSNEAYRYW